MKGEPPIIATGDILHELMYFSTAPNNLLPKITINNYYNK